MIEFKDFTVLSWNIRGAASAEVKRHLRGQLLRYRPSLVFIMETHIQFSKVKNFWDNVGYVPVHIVEARGHAGGIWCLSPAQCVFSFSVLDFFDQAISVEVKGSTGSWACTGVYASPTPTTRASCWDRIYDIRRRLQ